MSRFDCCQNLTSPVSRKSQPLPTMPCLLGGLPVSMLAWAVQVTAGITSRRLTHQPDWESWFNRGAKGSSREVRPTALMRIRGGLELSAISRQLSVLNYCRLTVYC